MKRCCSFAVLMLLSFPVHAADSVSFVIGGHRIHIEAPRHCNSLSCVAVSIPGIHEARSRRNKFNNDGTAVARGVARERAAGDHRFAAAKGVDGAAGEVLAGGGSMVVLEIAIDDGQAAAVAVDGAAAGRRDSGRWWVRRRARTRRAC